MIAILQSKKLMMFIGLILLITYYLEVSSSEITSKFEAIVCIFISLILTVKCRRSVPLFVGMIFISYCIYSIAMGEYLVGGNLAAPMLEIKNVDIYGKNIRILLFFLFSILCFFPKKIEKVTLPEPKDNIVIFTILIVLLIFIALFGINRTTASGYTVSISPIYEYSSILFLFSYYTSGDKRWRKIIIGGLMCVFILQDYYYGGRITSLQIMILALCTLLKNSISNIQIVFLTFGGILLNTAIAAYRVVYNLHAINIAAILDTLKTNLFVFDTPVYAFYASGTHIAAIEYFKIPFFERIDSLIYFLKSIFLGSNSNSGNVTLFVKEHYFSNEGGGLFPTNFYFWGGWIGVFIASIIISVIFNKFFSSNNELLKMINVIIIVTIPRWFIYSPLILFRTMFLISVVYLVYYLFNKVIVLSIKNA
ncbi:hypothetical protein ACNZ6T_002548 [Enterococcus faecium]|uniref:hypothetical protein n=1 Tax=Enterococcus TaxID=1350 RepID=UPI001CF23BF9|nr:MULTISPECIES: hypothetical protein [Enterococcus]MCA6756991.1 hypothetical protein [Enterococcus lactis]